jgi:hypothetical protein
MPLGHRGPADGPRLQIGAPERALLLLAVPLVGIPTLLAATGASGHAPIWEGVHLTLAAILGLAIAALSCRKATGRTREVRGWIAVALAACGPTGLALGANGTLYVAETYEMLVIEQGWYAERYRSWVEASLSAVFLAARPEEVRHPE